MTAFPQLTDEDIHSIFSFANYYARNVDPATIPDFKKSFDSCIQYQKLRAQILLKRDSLIIDNGPQVGIGGAIHNTLRLKGFHVGADPGEPEGTGGIPVPIVSDEIPAPLGSPHSPRFDGAHRIRLGG